MATSIPPRTKPYPNTGDLSAEEFDDAMNRWFEEQPDREEAMNQIAQEIEKYALNAEAAAGELDNAVWVSGTTYAAGQVRYSPVDFLNYRRKTNGAGTTDPSLDPTNWALLTKTALGGSDTASSATDITLTATSGRLQVITMTASGKKITLPAATGISKGSPIFVIKNAGNYRFSVNKNGGAFVCFVQPGQIVVLSCSDTSTSAGVWHVAGQDVEKLYDGNTPEVLNAVDSRLIAVANLTATKAICAYINNANGFLNAVIVNSGSASGTPVTINAEVSSFVSIAAQTATQATVVYKTSTGVTKGYVLDISGNTITPGSVATIDSGTTNAQGTSLIALSTTQLLCLFHSTGAKEKILDIASSVITASAIVAADATAASPDSIRVKKISSTKAIVCFRGSSPKNIVIRLQSVSGSTPAPTGTVLQLTTPTGFSSSDLPYGVVVMNANRAIIAQPLDRTLGDVLISLLDVSGTSPVLVSSAIVNLGLTSTANIEIVQLDANTAYMTWTGGLSRGVDSMIVTMTNDDRILTGPVNQRLDSSITATYGYLACAALDSSNVIQLTRNSNTFLSAKTINIAT